MSDVHPVALTIAGSDPSGGAGIQADLKTFAAFECFGTSVITAVTVQNTIGVRAVHHVPAEVVLGQLEALAEDIPPVAFKTGMLATADLVNLVASTIQRFRWQNYVLDPLMVSSSGARLLDEDAIDVLRSRVIPLANVVTPNLDEAEILAGMSVRDPEAMERAGRAILAMGAGAVLVKGGHLEGPDLIDILVTKTGARRFHHPRINSRSTHGTGCTLSAAITAGLAQRQQLEDAVTTALSYLQSAILEAPDLGKGRGPLWHGVRT